MARQETGRYAKPKDKQPTRHLYIANFGPGVGVPEEDLNSLLQSLGACHIEIQEPSRSILYASFGNVDVAWEAAERLKSPAIHEKHGRAIVVKFADFKSDTELERAEQKVFLRAEDCGVPGLKLYLDFVTPEKEQELLAIVDGRDWQTLAQRRVQHYGYVFEYKTRNVSQISGVAPLPAATKDVIAAMQTLQGVPEIDQLTVNEYTPGVGLAPHIDTHSAFTGAIASLSLAGGCVMEMRKEGDHRALYLPPRSLLVMSGSARYEWQHYIPHRKSDVIDGVSIPRAQRRVSFTFRQARGFDCDCEFPKYCDSRGFELPPTRLQQSDAQQSSSQTAEQSNAGNEAATACRLSHERGSGDRGEAEADVLSDRHPRNLSDLSMEEQHVHAVYEVIANHFSDTRFAVWPKVKEFLLQLPRHAVLADIGCGNGKYFPVRPDVIVLGSDRSFGLAEQASRLCGKPFRAPPNPNPVGPSPSDGASPQPPKERSAGGSSEISTEDANERNEGGLQAEDPENRQNEERVNASAGSSGRNLPVKGRNHTLRRGDCPKAPHADVLVADALHLPYQDASVDAAISIAVLHHISTVARRLQLLAEMGRVLKIGSLGLVTVWASEQENPKKLASWESLSVQPIGQSPGVEEGVGKALNSSKGDYFVPWHVPFHRADAIAAIKTARQEAGAEEVQGTANGQIDKEKSSVKFKRYYHLFDEGELQDLIQQVPAGLCVVSSFYDKSNWCCIFQKVDHTRKQ